MSVTITYDGKDYTFEHFGGMDRLCKVRLIGKPGSIVERVWVQLHGAEEIDTRYKGNSYGEAIICSLRNDAISGNAPWGTYIVAMTNGKLCPECDLTKLTATCQGMGGKVTQ